MLKFYLLLYITITTQTVRPARQTINIDDYMCLPITTRLPHIAAVPSLQISMFGETFPATRHHIIPLNLLSDFYNLVVRNDPTRSSYADVLRQRVQAIHNFFATNPASGAPCRRRPANLQNESGTNTFEADIRMASAFSWMPGNLFYGPPPHRRFNDPGDGFEVRAARIIGIEAFTRLQRLYENMRNYVDSPAYRTVRNFYDITDDIYDIGTSRNRPYEFDENNWMRVYDIDRRRIFYDIRNITIPDIEELPKDELRKKRDTEDRDDLIEEEYLMSARAVCDELVKTGYFRDREVEKTKEVCRQKGYEWEPRTGSCYKFHRAAQTWRQALSTCHAEGGHLAIINSQTESTVLKELYEKYPKETIIGATEHRHAFISFQEYRDEQWATIYGDTLAETGFTEWEVREPSSWQGNEFCGSIHVNGLLNNAPCDDKSPFICEITPNYDSYSTGKNQN